VNPRNRVSIRKIKELFWPEDSLRPVNVWAVLDAAKDERIYDLVSHCYLDKCCLFAGDLAPQLERAAPHLLQVSPRDSVTDSLLEHGWVRLGGSLCSPMLQSGLCGNTCGPCFVSKTNRDDSFCFATMIQEFCVPTFLVAVLEN
jgi:hypothetical protein